MARSGTDLGRNEEKRAGTVQNRDKVGKKREKVGRVPTLPPTKINRILGCQAMLFPQFSSLDPNPMMKTISLGGG